MSRNRARAVLVLAAAVMIAAAALTIGALDRRRHQVDLTADDNLTLTDTTKEVVRALRGGVEVTALVAIGSGGRAEAVALLDRYRRLDRRIAVRVVDPADIPGELRRLGVDGRLEELVVRRGERVERSTTITEQDITAALARLERNRTPIVCFTSGHGEPLIDDTTGSGIAAFTGALTRNGAVIQHLDLLTGGTVPPECRTLVLVSPTSALTAAADPIVRYLDAGGRALVLADPSSTVDLTSLLAPYGLGLERGIVVEGDAESRLPRDPVSVVARSFPTANPLVRGLAPLVLPAVQAVRVADTPSNTTLVRSTRLAYLERDPSTFAYDPAVDLKGPLPLAAAADYSENVGGKVTRTRIVLVGDADLATNDVIDQGDDGRFLLQAVDWLTSDDDLVTINANLARVRPLALTPARAGYARLLLAGVIPATFLLLGLATTLIRRRR
jgi:ABC-type uncharacterized transport system involved in gliding motility auxiliary subunit